MNLEQFLSQFHFETMSEVRRCVISGNVSINRNIFSSTDLKKNTSTFNIKSGDYLKIGKQYKYLIRDDHLILGNQV